MFELMLDKVVVGVLKLFVLFREVDAGIELPGPLNLSRIECGLNSDITC
jgi:hypothetical protein